MIRLLVVNCGDAALHAAVRVLAHRGRLGLYLTRYAAHPGRLTRALASLPVLGRCYSAAFGRRLLASEIPPDLVSQGPLLPDLIHALLVRLANPWPGIRPLAVRMNQFVARNVSRRACQHGAEAEQVLANLGCAEGVFRATQGLRVLHYPTAHLDYTQRLVKEEQRRLPAFAASWPHASATQREQARRECALADRILVGSSFARDSLIEMGVPAAKVLRVPYGVDPRVFNPPAQRVPGRPARILFTGQFTQRKGIHELLEACRRLPRDQFELRLIGNFAGDRECLAPYRDLFTLLPHLPRAQLAREYRAADLFVFPTLIEGLPLTVMEAMACGLPVVTTVNGPGDLVRPGKDGFIVPMRDPEALIARLSQLIENPELRLRLGQNAAERALVFSVENQVSALLDALNQGRETHPGLVA